MSVELEHLVAGTVAGMSSTTLLYPLDLIKVREGSAADGLVDSTRTIVRREGFRGLYAGLTPAVLASAASWGGYFYFYELIKHRKLTAYAASCGTSAPRKLHVVDHLLAGVEAGSIMVVITNPLWIMKTRLQIQGQYSTPNKYTGFRNIFATMLREEGIRGFYKGFLPSLLLTTHGAVQFAIYEQLKLITQRIFGDDSSFYSLGLITAFNSSISKIVASTLTYPYQVVKSRMQQRGAVYEAATGSSSRFSSIVTGVISCTIALYRAEGVPGFFKGLVPNTLRVVPNAAVTFIVYEECMKAIKAVR